MKKQYYAVVYWHGRHKLRGWRPNKKTGEYSYACTMVVFNDKKDRDEWVRQGHAKNQIRCSIESKRHLRKLFLGESMEEFKSFLNDSNFNDEEYHDYLEKLNYL